MKTKSQNNSNSQQVEDFDIAQIGYDLAHVVMI